MTRGSIVVSRPCPSLTVRSDGITLKPPTEDGKPGKPVEHRLALGKPVEGAVIFRTRLDMSPDKMEAMTTKIEPLTESEPGVYKFRADFTMAGGWAFRVMAKVPGEKDTVQGIVVFQAKD